MENTKIYKIIQGMPPAARHKVAPFLATYAGGEQTLSYRLFQEIVDHLEYGTNRL